MKSLQGLLGPALGRDELIRTALAQRVLRGWSAIVGETMAGRSRPERYDRGTVWVAVEGSAWAQELRLAKPQILEKLREAAGNPDLFEDLRFGVRPLEPLSVPPEGEEKPASTQRPSDSRSIREIAEARLANWPEGP